VELVLTVQCNGESKARRKAIGWGHISEFRKIEEAQRLAASPEPSMPSNFILSNLRKVIFLVLLSHSHCHAKQNFTR